MAMSTTAKVILGIVSVPVGFMVIAFGVALTTPRYESDANTGRAVCMKLRSSDKQLCDEIYNRMMREGKAKAAGWAR
jgi:hypothetical protein